MNNWQMWEAIGTVGATILALILSLRETISSYFKLKPDLIPVRAFYNHLVSKTYLVIEIKNKGRLLASDVNCQWLIITKNDGKKVMDTEHGKYPIGLIAPGMTVEYTMPNVMFQPRHTIYEIWIQISDSTRFYRPYKLPLEINI